MSEPRDPARRDEAQAGDEAESLETGLVPRSRLHAAYFWAFCMTVFALGAVAIPLFARFSGRLVTSLDDEGVQAAAVAELVRQGSGVWDSFPDPDVTRVLQPDLDGRAFRDQEIDSNLLGLREADFRLPKPPGVTRVVILGDSFVFGPGVEADERVGHHLAAALRERTGDPDIEIEVLHVGLGSWNALAEATYLRRALSRFDPDLVVHVLVHNDLDDVNGVRGFGSVATHTPQGPAQIEGFFVNRPARRFSESGFSYLNAGLSYESLRRYARAADAMERLEQGLRALGGEYLVLMYWQDHAAVAREQLTGGLDSPVVFLSSQFRETPAYRVGIRDPHWSVEGHRFVARFLYGAIEQHGLLGDLRFEPWPDGVSTFRQENRRGLAEAEARTENEAAGLEPSIRFPALGSQAARQIYGGISRRGEAGPVAVILLPRTRAVRIIGRAPDRPELQGATVTVSIDDTAVGTIELEQGQAFNVTVPVPRELLDRSAVEVRLEADDFVYGGRDLRQPLSLVLERVTALR